MTRSLRRTAIVRAYGISLLVALAAYVPGLWYFGWRWDPGFYTAVSLHASRDGHWWTLARANLTYFNKPPLWFWVHGAFASMLGEADWVLRLPDLLAALACVGLLVSIVLRLHGPRVALIAGVALALCDEYLRRISQFRLDIPHAALMLLALRLVLAGCMPGPHGRPAGAASLRPWLIVMAGVPIGLAMLIKPIFALLALLLAAVWILLVGKPSRRAALWLIPAALVAVTVAAPWHVSMWMIHGDSFLNAYFLRESLRRATGAQFNPEPWYAYFVYLSGIPTDLGRRLGGRSVALWYVPWVLCVTGSLAWWACGRIRGRKLAPRISPAGGILAQVWTLGTLAALCLFSDKKSWYLMPVYPGLAWIAALFLARITPGSVRRGLRHIAWPVALAALAAVLIFRPSFERDSGDLPDMVAVETYLRAHPDADYWNGSVQYYDNARLYIASGVWPKFVHDPNTGRRWTVPVGAYLVFDKKRKPPDPSDEIVLDGERFVVVRRTSADAPQPTVGTGTGR